MRQKREPDPKPTRRIVRIAESQPRLRQSRRVNSILGRWLIPRSVGAASEPSYKKAHPLFVDPPSDMSMSCARRAEFESAPSRRVPADFSVFTTFLHSTTDRPKKFHHFFDFKHHHSTHPDGPAFCGCSGTSKIIGKPENPYENRRFCVSGGA